MGLIKLTFLGIFTLFSVLASAEISVAFFEARDINGQLVQLESDGRFFHAAVSYRGGWLHAYPRRGVEWVPSLSEVGTPHTILNHKNHPALEDEEVLPLVGLPFDMTYTWVDSTSTYCSKLIGKLLRIAPLEMSFSSEVWQRTEFANQRGLGLSPDDIYRELLKRGFQPVGCARLLLVD